jgi:lysine N-acyltransferase
MTGALIGAPPLPLLHEPWSARVVTPSGSDLELVWRWMNEPHVAATWNQAWSQERWAAELTEQLTHDFSLPCLVSLDGHVLAYIEVYWAARHPLGALYPARPHDLGIHIVFGDINTTGRGLCTQMLRGLAEGLLAADPECTRIVGEPNIDNKAIIRAGMRAGFRQHSEVVFPHKTAALMMFEPK